MKKFELEKKNNGQSTIIAKTLDCHCGCNGQLIPAAQKQYISKSSVRQLILKCIFADNFQAAQKGINLMLYFQREGTYIGKTKTKEVTG